MLKRGSGPLISICIPSRQRFGDLSDTIRSCSDKAVDPSRLEYLLKFDTDDHDMIRRIPELPQQDRLRIIISERLRGYFDLHLFITDLCKLARGDWVWLFNDDARVETQGWDEILANFDPHRDPEFKGCDDVCCLNPGAPDADDTDVFPMVRRAAVQRMGHFSAHTHNDTYAQYIYENVKARVRCPEIRVRHLINVMTDATHSHSAAAQGSSFEDFHATFFGDCRAKDSDLLQSMIDDSKK